MWSNQSTGNINPGEMPISRTLQYRKVTKPLLERKRRARINHCLDELKELMVNALQAQGENVSKLEKADILELTVRYMHTITPSTDKQHNENSNMQESQRFQAGFAHCIRETYQYLHQSSEVDSSMSQRLMSHLGNYVDNLASSPPLWEQPKQSPGSSTQQHEQMTRPLTVQVPSLQRPFSPPVSPMSPNYSQRQSSLVSSTSGMTSQHLLSPMNDNYNINTLSCSPSVEDLSKPLSGLLIPAKKYPIRPEPQRMWRPW